MLLLSFWCLMVFLRVVIFVCLFHLCGVQPCMWCVIFFLILGGTFPCALIVKNWAKITGLTKDVSDFCLERL